MKCQCDRYQVKKKLSAQTYGAKLPTGGWAMLKIGHLNENLGISSEHTIMDCTWNHSFTLTLHVS
jgi:hypothetical protein